ncbi:MAG TPA: S53 family peptidase [Ktedonobacteraceae bacterium]|nr:S53 family peptidase [Ktedonobacteraceae bacterium]
MIQRSMTPRRPGYLIVTNLTMLGLVVSAFFSLVGRTHASPTTPYVFQPYNKIASNTPIADPGDAQESFPCQAPTAIQTCYGPSQMRKAYNIQSLLDDGITGKGSTIVIVDAYQAPDIQADLRSFDKIFGLKDTELNIIAPDGLTPFDPKDFNQVGWSAEISLDVEWAHAIAPDATIDLVLSKTAEDKDLLSALNYVGDENLGDVVSMSFGGNESCTDSAQLWHQAFRNAASKGITLLAASGDSGAAEGSCDGKTAVKGVSYPAADSFVTAVGGTELHADPSTGKYHDEAAWIGSGGGFSTSTPKPFYQNSVNSIGKYRGIPDVSYDASPLSGVIIKWSEAPFGLGLYVIGGTSAGSPQWAGIVALAAQDGKSRIGLLNSAIYSSDQQAHYSSNFRDVTSGNNTVGPIQGYNAGPSWDAVTGWGSPQAADLVPYLANHNATNLSSSDLASL